MYSDNDQEELSLTNNLPKIKFKKSKKIKTSSTNLKKRNKIIKLDYLDDEDDEIKQKRELPVESKSHNISKKSKLQQLAEEEEESKIRGETKEDINGEYESDSEQDRDWYLGDDFGHVYGDESHNPFGNNVDYDELKENQLKTNQQKKSNKKRFKNEEIELWEKNRMMNSGTIRRKYIDMDFKKDIEDTYSDIIVNNKLPIFLKDKNINDNLIKNTISPFRDPESDMAIFAKQGSSLVKQRLQSKEKKKQAKDATSINGTKLSNIIGQDKEEKEEEEKVFTNDKFINSLEEEESNEELETSEFSKKLTLKEQQKFLPVYQVRDRLLQIIDENQLVVIIGETGSGKTTQLTQYLYEHGYGSRGMIACTQPRRVAAMSVAKRVSEEMQCKLGTTVGFSIRFEDLTSKETKIRYMTDGILLKESLTDYNLNKYSCIIIDEAHERTLNTDILLGIFKKILTRRIDLKIIITSATMNADKFSKFFGNAPQFTIPGRTFPVDIFYSRTTPMDYIESCIKTCLTIHLSKPLNGDVLIFLTGKSDIDTLCELLKEKFDELANDSNNNLKGVGEIPPYEILPIYSQLPADLQTKVFKKFKKGIRKFVIATNIAETSLTIDNIKYVVDCGYYKIKIFNSKMGMDTLQMAPISLANAIQRAGRAGRTAPGIAYRLYTESALKYELFKETIPEIQRTNLSNTILMLKNLKIKNINKFPFLDSPLEANINNSLYDLWTLNALNDEGELTKLGEEMIKFPMEPNLSKILINSIKYQCSEEIIIIVSMLSVPNVFYRPKERQDESDSIREKFLISESDHLTLLNVYSQWKANNCSSNWCNKHFLHFKSLKRAKDIKDQLTLIMKQQNLKIISNDKNWDNIKKCICTGFFHQSAKLKNYGKYTNLKNSLELNLHPTSSLFNSGDLPKFIIYHELIFTTKEYMNYVTEVEPEWIAEFSNGLFELNVKKFDQIKGNTIWDV